MEIMKGRFSLKLPSHLRMEQKIQNYAGEQAAFHLHKKRDFLSRLDQVRSKNVKDNQIALFSNIIETMNKEAKTFEKYNKAL